MAGCGFSARDPTWNVCTRRRTLPFSLRNQPGNHCPTSWSKPNGMACRSSPTTPRGYAKPLPRTPQVCLFRRTIMRDLRAPSTRSRAINRADHAWEKLRRPTPKKSLTRRSKISATSICTHGCGASRFRFRRRQEYETRLSFPAVTQSRFPSRSRAPRRILQLTWYRKSTHQAPQTEP